jgi:mRNA interferase YafQ
MRSTKRTTIRYPTFRADLKARKNGSAEAWRTLSAQLKSIVKLLQLDRPLPADCNNHRIKGDWQGWTHCSYCYVTDELLLLYRLPDDDHLELLRLGPYPALFPPASIG